MNKIRPVVLLILDGWGYAPNWGGNATSIAMTPNFDRAWRNYSHTTLCASGECVGLPGHERGNSEVGHLNLGAGMIPKQDNTIIDNAIKDNSFFTNSTLVEAIDHAQKNNSNLHIMGILSNGDIHGNIRHLFALLDLCYQQNFKNVYIHGFTDGRDTEPMAALSFVYQLEKKFSQIGFGKIATLSGRYYAMDRDDHWERIEKVYNAMTQGIGDKAISAQKAITNSYSQGIQDEFIVPTVITDTKDNPIATVNDHDSLIFFNFRSDRAREISMAFMEDKFDFFKRKKINHLFYAGMIPYGYEQELKFNFKSAFGQEKIINPLAKVLSDNNLKQLHIAETEKYAHVTYFFNGGIEKSFKNEDRVLIPSPRVASYAQKPEMSVDKITEQLLLKIKKYDFIVANFANGDMVGHTGDFNAAVRACEAIDNCLGKVISEVLRLNGVLLVLADHGNVEQMVNIKTGQPDTEHTNNPVPFMVVGKSSLIGKPKLVSNGILSDVAPTILNLIGISKPKEMTGKNLIE